MSLGMVYPSKHPSQTKVEGADFFAERRKGVSFPNSDYHSPRLFKYLMGRGQAARLLAQPDPSTVFFSIDQPCFDGV